MTMLLTAADAERLAELRALHTQCAALDAEIVALQQATAPLDELLSSLTAAAHPALWLVLGREGIDRPGGLGAITGREVVTVTRRAWRTTILLVVLALLLGMALTGALVLWGGMA